MASGASDRSSGPVLHGCLGTEAPEGSALRWGWRSVGQLWSSARVGDRSIRRPDHGSVAGYDGEIVGTGW
jgi:hypothetical protein